MIPLIHVVNIRGGECEDNPSVTDTFEKTSFFIFKESPTSNYYHVICQQQFGNSFAESYLYLKKSGVKSYYNTVECEGVTKISLLSMHEEYLWSCPVWTYTELYRRVPAHSLHKLNIIGEEGCPCCNAYLLDNYLDVIRNASFVPVGYEGYPQYGNYNESVYDSAGNFVECDGWVQEDY